MHLSARFYGAMGLLLFVVGVAVAQSGLLLLNLPVAASMVFWGIASILLAFCLLQLATAERNRAAPREGGSSPPIKHEKV